MLNYKVIWISSVLISIVVTTGYGQLSRKTQEVWPSVKVYYRLNEQLRLYATAGGTKLDSSSYTDGSLGIFMDVFSFPVLNIRGIDHFDELPGKYFRFRLGYQFTASPPNKEDPFEESLFVAQTDGRFIIPFDIVFSCKNRIDLRFKNQDFSARYRPMLLFEKNLKTDFLFFMASCFIEYYANFGQSNLNRFRLQLGLEFKITKEINYKTFWNHQFANDPSIQRVDAFGMSLKFYFQRF
ncbi:DUF2490 domain-containing protein [Flexithrix dorotheae]|uniref:DUF2490 domain-containing protein n=1 Tax=Flexithrix dorotheae TaxID=70993 RepID=UPI00037FD1EB|nr:DUF2490 domain-containing protein [Flexithrix dorotheae]